MGHPDTLPSAGNVRKVLDLRGNRIVQSAAFRSNAGEYVRRHHTQARMLHDARRRRGATTTHSSAPGDGQVRSLAGLFNTRPKSTN